jgi:hypothetical protein
MFLDAPFLLHLGHDTITLHITQEQNLRFLKTNVKISRLHLGRSRELFDKPTAVQLVNTFPAFADTFIFITMFTKAHN